MRRRELIKQFMSGLILPLVPASVNAAALKTGRRLILIELSGANDGLNTIIPFKNDHYYKLRPNLAINASDRIVISNDFAKHQALSKLGNIWDRGELAIIQGLGYPGANRSHFKSIALWETGGDGTQAGRTGWLTEDIEDKLTNYDLDAHGISLDGGMGIFTSPKGIWLSMTSAAQFKRLSEESFHSNVSTNNPALMNLLDRANALNSSMKKISGKLSRSRTMRFNIRGGDLGRQLSMASSLISAGISTPILKVKIDGFDTHEDQLWRHEDLLRDLGSAISGFAQQMRRIREWDNTIILTYSEFGRRPTENYTRGTDHGTAAPHFVAGGMINGGLYGQHPDLGKLINGDMQFTMDYRSVYEMILNNWFEIKENKFSNFRNSSIKKVIKKT